MPFKRERNESENSKSSPKFKIYSNNEKGHNARAIQKQPSFEIGGKPMINEKEVFIAGMVIALVMLASGFSMLFIASYTGEGAVVLSLGVLTMVLVLMMKVLVAQFQGWMDYNKRIEKTLSELLTLGTETKKS